jgi:hypothetical protein
VSDFDDVLERLITDPAFPAALRANPDAALAGYRLQPDERQLLAAQVDAHTGEERTVEMRVSKSGVMGMVGPVVSAMGTGRRPGVPVRHRRVRADAAGRGDVRPPVRRSRASARCR